MADIATPSAATMSTINAGSESVAERVPKTKPEKPDEQKYKESLAKAEAEYAVAQEEFNAIKAKLDLAQPLTKDSPAGKRQQELRAELQVIRQQQSGFKSSRTSTQEKIAALDAQLKSRMAEQKTARSRVPYKSVEEIDREIQRLEKQVDAGTMKLVDEKKALAEISSMRKQRKGFAGFDEARKGIDDVRAQISELRKSLDNPEATALSQKFDTISQELAGIKSDQDQAYKNLNSLRDERNKLHADQQEKYSAVKDIKDKYYKANRAHRDYEREQARIRQERYKAEMEAKQKERRKQAARQKLEEASQPAYMDEILTAEGLIRYFDPSTNEAEKTLRAPSGFAAEAQRTVEAADFKGTKVLKKDEREDNYFLGTGGKKGRKGKKGGAAGSPAPGTPTEGKFNLSIGIIEELAKVNIEPPMNQSNVAAVVDKLKAKRDNWKSEQDKKTKENIERAQKEIDRLEAEASMPASTASTENRRAHETARKPATVEQSVNGTASAKAEQALEKDAEADVAEDLKKASIEDRADE
ncbi:MAG: hypothetical protein LQ343_004151 [Gyalolechia ehrenbergii]|nr:MAG: hypothetical protein LQ343_004151 [Gyalolechia ehrenbergii]